MKGIHQSYIFCCNIKSEEGITILVCEADRAWLNLLTNKMYNPYLGSMLEQVHTVPMHCKASGKLNNTYSTRSGYDNRIGVPLVH